jgi:hypothetical protein
VGATGPTGPSGVVSSTFTAGQGNMPTATNQFLAPPVAVTITAGQRIYVSSNRAFGTISAGGAGSLDLYICYQSGAGAPVLVSAGIFDNSMPQNQRLTLGISAVIVGLAAGTYNVGMCGDDDGNGQWNNSEWGYTSALVY